MMDWIESIWRGIYDSSGAVYSFSVYMLVFLSLVALFLVSIVGCVIPVIPGPSLAFLGVVAWKFTIAPGISYACLAICLALAAFAQVLDWWLPIKYTPTKRGAWGAFVGVMAGAVLAMVFPPFAVFAIFLSPLAFAFAFEYHGNADFVRAWESGKGAFVGTFMTVVAKAFIIFMMIAIASFDAIV